MSAAPGRSALTPHSPVITASQLNLQLLPVVDVFLGSKCVVLSEWTAQGIVLKTAF